MEGRQLQQKTHHDMTVEGNKFQEVEEVYLWILAKERRGCLAALSSMQVLSHFSLVVMMAKRLGDIRTTCNLDHVKRYLHGTDQSVTELPADDSTLEAMPTDLSPQEESLLGSESMMNTDSQVLHLVVSSDISIQA